MIKNSKLILLFQRAADSVNAVKHGSVNGLMRAALKGICDVINRVALDGSSARYQGNTCNV